MTSSVLQRPTLVLNRSWQPVRVATVARALIMLYRGTARVVDPDDFQTYDWDDWATMSPRVDEPSVRGVDLVFRAPEVVTLDQYNKLPRVNVAFNRRNLFKRDKYCCQYCGVRLESDQLSIDHVLPRSQGGLTSWENCVLACTPCNHRKANRTPIQAHMRLKVQPKQPTWQPFYANHSIRIESWSKFISEAYWHATLEK